MKVSWEYRCNEGHAWTILRDQNDPENPSDSYCPFGHAAVMLHKAALLDMVQVGVRPAARVVDAVTQQIGHEYKYFLVITDLIHDKERISRQLFSWTESKAVMDRFRIRMDMPGTVTAERAWQILDLMDDPTSSSNA